MAARSENNPTSLVDKFILARSVANFMKLEDPKRKLKLHVENTRLVREQFWNFETKKKYDVWPVFFEYYLLNIIYSLKWEFMN